MAICIGCGLVVDSETGLLTVELDPDGGIVCGDDGLAIASTAISATDSATIDFSGTGASGSPLTASVKESAATCNVMQLRADGVYVPCSVANTTAIQQSPQHLTNGVAQNIVPGPGYSFLNDNSPTNIHICNPTACTLDGIVVVEVGDIYFDISDGAIASAYLKVNINSAGLVFTEPEGRQIAHNTGTGNMFHNIYLFHTLYLSLAAGTCVDYQWQLLVLVNNAGSGTDNLQTDANGPNFVTRWVLTPTGTCT